MSKRCDICSAREPVESLTVEQLHQELVTDAVALHATDLKRAVTAYERIGKLTGHGAEQAYQDVREAVKALTGRYGMPVG